MHPPAMPRPGRARPRRWGRLTTVLVVAVAALSACSPAPPGPSGDSGAVPVVHRSGPMKFGMYVGRAEPAEARAIVGAPLQVATTYYNADQVTQPDLAALEAEVDQGISPVITLDWKNGPFTRAQIGAWGPAVKAYFARFTGGLRLLSDYAAAKGNGTAVYFADEHEPVVKIVQHKYTFAGYGARGGPTVAESAAAWNAVMRHVRAASPRVVRVYWYGGSGSGEQSFERLLRPSLVQMATFDPYRWRRTSSSATAAQLWGSRIDHLLTQPFMRRADGTIKPWGLTEWGTDVSHGDRSNATFVRQTISYLDRRGATFAVYFDRVDQRDSADDFVITGGRAPRTLAAYRTAVAEHR